MNISAVAGTFSVIHDGHRALIGKAFEVGDEVLVGITSDSMASSHAVTLPLEMRRKALEEYLGTFGKPYTVFVVDDMFGPREFMDRADVLIVSQETEENGKEVVRDRFRRRGKPLGLITVPLVMADTGQKISASEILRGRYSESGHRPEMRINVGSANPVKVEAVRSVMSRIYGSVAVTGVEVESGVPEQPFESAVREGAVKRASNALGDADLGVGIEAGVFERIDGLFDVQYCAVIDRDGRLTVGTGPGFQYPPRIASLVRAGLTVGEAMRRAFGEDDIGRRQGAIGFLSNGLLDRKALTEDAVMAAMVPRITDNYVVGG